VGVVEGSAVGIFVGWPEGELVGLVDGVAEG